MRKPEPWLHKQSGNWKVQFGSKQHNLGKDEKAAWEKYYKLMAERGQPVSKDPAVFDVLNRYLAWCESNREPTTFDRAQRHLKRFAKHVGKRLKVADLTPELVNAWIRADYSLNSSTYQNDAIGCVVAAINRARLPNPIAGMEKPTRNRREFYLEPQQWRLLLDEVKDSGFYDYCVLALHSGSRPQETRAIEARHFDKTNSRLVFPRSEAKGKKRPRYIYLDDVAREIIERRMRPKGPLMTNGKCNPWNKNNVNCRFRRLKKKLKMPKLCAYTLRHSFAVWKLTEGVEVAIVAKLMGHADSRMVEERYGHIEANATLMLRAASQTSSPLEVVSDSAA